MCLQKLVHFEVTTRNGQFTLKGAKPTCLAAVRWSYQTQFCFLLRELAVQKKLIILDIEPFACRLVGEAVEDTCMRKELKKVSRLHTEFDGIKISETMAYLTRKAVGRESRRRQTRTSRTHEENL